MLVVVVGSLLSLMLLLLLLLSFFRFVFVAVFIGGGRGGHDGVLTAFVGGHDDAVIAVGSGGGGDGDGRVGCDDRVVVAAVVINGNGDVGFGRALNADDVVVGMVKVAVEVEV